MPFFAKPLTRWVVYALGLLTLCAVGYALSTALRTPPAVAAPNAANTAPTVYNPLWIPPTLTGTTFNLMLAPTTKQIWPGAASNTYGYNNNDFWGPTLIMRKGDFVQIHLTNTLNEATTTHWHGFHLPAEMDGGPHQIINAGATWSPSFEVKNNAATYWYHPHLHEQTQKQLNYGAGGLIIVQDDAETALALPRTYGVDDIPLVLTSRSFVANNQINTTKVYGDYMLTNGTLSATVDLPAQVVRLRILNAEIERAYNLGFSDNRTFYLVATDGGLVNTSVPLTRLVMLPGERNEILVNLSADGVGSTLDLKAYNNGQAFGFPGGEPNQTGQFGSLLNNITFNVLHISVITATANPVTSIPTTLANNVYWTASDATTQRTLNITDQGPGTPFSFNNTPYNMSTINYTVTLNTIEQWAIVNNQTFGHAFHIHDIQFKIVYRSTGAVPLTEQGWKDTLFIRPNETVRFVMKFDDFASSEHPFMYHCHMANHEDEGLMGQFLVTTTEKRYLPFVGK